MQIWLAFAEGMIAGWATIFIVVAARQGIINYRWVKEEEKRDASRSKNC